MGDMSEDRAEARADGEDKENADVQAEKRPADQTDDLAAAGTYVSTGDSAMRPMQKRTSLTAALLLIVAGIYTIRGFLPALVWAVIFAIALWPLVERTAARFPKQRRTVVPLAWILAVAIVFIVPLVMIVVPLIGDAHAAADWIAQAKAHGIPVPSFLPSLPFGDRLVPLWQRDLAQPGWISGFFAHAMRGGSLETARAIGAGALHRLVLVGFMLLALFFLLRDGDEVVEELKIGSRRAFGPAGENVGQQLIRSVRGTVNGLVLVGLGEGVILGIAYTFTGMPHPTLFGLLTALLAMVPFGAMIAFIVAALILAALGKLVAAAIILGLGSVVVFLADHFVRPALIGGATRLPFIWVLLGILGGVEGWGLVGLFLGPAIMAALVLLWREWVGVQRGPLNPRLPVPA